MLVISFLDQLVDENKISQERAVRLKRRYNHLLESIEWLGNGEKCEHKCDIIKHMLV